MNTLQVIMVIYLGLMLLVGVFLSKKINNITDFLLAGRSLGFILCTATLAATHLGGGFILGSGEAGYLTGVSGIWYGASTGLGLLLLGFLFASKLRSLSLTTVADYLEERYGGKSVRTIAAILSLIAIVGILAAQVKAAEGIMIMLGFNATFGAVVATVIFIGYTALSGMWGVTVTDFVQVIIAGGGIVVASVLAFFKVGGFQGISSQVSISGFFSFTSIGLDSIAWILLPTVMYTLIGQDFLQRLFSAKDQSTARKSGIASGVLLIAISFFPVLAGMVAQVLYPNLDNARSAIPILVTEIFPEALGGIVLAAIMAAVMSTADSLLCAGASHVTNDLYLKTFKDSKLDEKQLLRLTIFSTLAIGSISLFVALVLPSIISALIYAYTMFTAGVFIPVVGGLVWANGTKLGALSSMILGSVVALLGLTNVVSFGTYPVVIVSTVFSLVVYIVVSKLSNKNF